jgi:AcrR family transcriptional regulator
MSPPLLNNTLLRSRHGVDKIIASQPIKSINNLHQSVNYATKEGIMSPISSAINAAPPAKIDPRVRRTRQMLRDALLALIDAKGYEAITVQDIAEQAGLNRATFYLHYRDKLDLLTRSIEDVRDELVAQAQPFEEDLPQSIDFAPPTLTRLFEHIGAHANFYRIMLGKDGLPTVAIQMRTHIEDFITARLVARYKDPSTHLAPLLIVARFQASGQLGVIIWWLEQRQPHPPAQMATWIWRMALLGIYDTLGGKRRVEG